MTDSSLPSSRTALAVYYDVEEKVRLVTIRAVGIKNRNRVLVAGKEIEL